VVLIDGQRQCFFIHFLILSFFIMLITQPNPWRAQKSIIIFDKIRDVASGTDPFNNQNRTCKFIVSQNAGPGFHSMYIAVAIIFHEIKSPCF
jgi:hypothetical protein